MKRPTTPLLLLSLTTLSLATDAPPASQPAPATPFVVYGTCTDGTGNPLRDVVITARCGADQLFTTGSTKTDKAGHYRLSFSPGVEYERGLGHPVVGFQVATILARKSGMFEKNLGRQGNLAMTDMKSPPQDHTSHFAGVVHPDKPYELDFVFAKGATVHGTLLDPSGNAPKPTYVSLAGPYLNPGTMVLQQIKTDDAGRFKFTNVPTNYAWSFQLRDRLVDTNLASAPFTLADTTASSFTLTFDPDKHTLTSVAVPTTQPATTEKK